MQNKHFYKQVLGDIRPWRMFGILLVLLVTEIVQAGVPVDQVPLFRIRARVLSSGGADPTNTFTFGLGGSNTLARGSEWSAWMFFTRPMAAQALSQYPNTYAGGWPVVTHLNVVGGKDPCRVRMEVQVNGLEEVRAFNGELFGTSWGLLLWMGDGRPYVATMAEYNKMFWSALTSVKTKPKEQVRLFPIVDRFISGDQDRVALRDGIHSLAKAGFSALMTGPDAQARQILLETGRRRTAWAVYCPPGYAFDHSAGTTPDAISKWARDQAEPFLKAGYAPEDMAIFAMSDEPGWYYPSCFSPLTNSPPALQRFRDYLRDQGLKPKDVGAAKWEEVWPIGRSRAVDLPSRRLFYWTMRFFPWDSARHFANCTRALEAAFYTNMPVFANWNFFSGRLYVPGGVANNPDRASPDAAMGGHDWFEFGRMRGCTMLWTEDWFGDELAYNWSYHCARLRSAARLGGVEFGGYIVPRTAGGRAEGLAQKIAAILGNGGKGIKYFVFGPEYNFPGNCYSFSAGLLTQMAEAHRWVGLAEPLLWPGRPLPAEVAILMPRSAQLWDEPGISDATNVRLNNATVDYMAEVYNLYLAFMHANIPMDFVEEDQLTEKGLQGIKALYITEPNIPEEYQKELVQWVKHGGVLVSVSGAGQRDRYNDPCPVLWKGLEIHEKDRNRLSLPNLYALPGVNAITGSWGMVGVVGMWNQLESEKGLDVLCRFTNNVTPAVVSKTVDKGRAVLFTWLPGVSYAQSPQNKDGMLINFSGACRELITTPAREAGIKARVRPDQPMVEAPLLMSAKGGVVTLLNWTGAPIAKLGVTMDWNRSVSRVQSVRQGPLKYELNAGVLTFALPVKGMDFVLVWP